MIKESWRQSHFGLPDIRNCVQIGYRVDHLNRPIKMTNAAKASVWDAVWQPFGGAHSITGSATLNARLPGQWFQMTRPRQSGPD
jgi:hypothetical protein